MVTEEIWQTISVLPGIDLKVVVLTKTIAKLGLFVI